MLTARSARLDIQTRAGLTPSDLAQKNGHKELAEQLTQKSTNE
jgi:hypothetical protein